MMPNRRISMKAALIVLATLIVVGGIVVVNLRAFQLRYYKWQMERAHQAYLGPKTTSGGFVVVNVPDAAVERYERYRQKLVELGGITERHYSCRHLRVRTDESEHFTRLLVSGRCPNHVDFSSPYPDKPEPLQLTVWCWNRDASAWDHFVAEHDVADYHERFIGRDKEEEEKGVGKNPERPFNDYKDSRK